MPSSIQVYNQATRSFNSLQTTLLEKQALVGADSIASKFSDFGSDINLVEGYKTSINRSERYIATIDNATRNLNSSYQAIDYMLETAITFKESIAIENSVNASVNDLKNAASVTLDNIQGALNTRNGSNYVFSGSKTNDAAVSDLKGVDSFINGAPTANYYNGDGFKASAQISSSLNIEYGVVASDSSFQNLISAVQQAGKAENVSQEDLESSSRLLDQAIEELTTLRADMGNDLKVFEQSREFQVSAQQNFEIKLDEEIQPDIVELSIEIASIEASLQASFQTYANISRLSLLTYI